MSSKLERFDGWKKSELLDFIEKIITKLDELDLDDFFGTEGWRHYFGFED